MDRSRDTATWTQTNERIINDKHLKWQRDTFKHHYFHFIWASFFVTSNWFQFDVFLSSFHFDINSNGNHQTTLISLYNRCLSSQKYCHYKCHIKQLENLAWYSIISIVIWSSYNSSGKHKYKRHTQICTMTW